MTFAPAGILICEGDPTCLIFSPSIITKAGVRTFPVRGSSNRPALTRVTGAMDWALSCTETDARSTSAKNLTISRPQVNRSCSRNSRAWHMGICMSPLATTYLGNATTLYVLLQVDAIAALKLAMQQGNKHRFKRKPQ